MGDLLVQGLNLSQVVFLLPVFFLNEPSVLVELPLDFQISLVGSVELLALFVEVCLASFGGLLLHLSQLLHQLVFLLTDD